MTVLENMLIYYNNSDPQDIYRKVIGTILQNLDKISGSTIYDLAEICYVSPTTISRMCKKLYMENFTQFRNELTETLSNYSYYNRFVGPDDRNSFGNPYEKYFNSLHELIKQVRKIDGAALDAIASALNDSKTIHFYGYGAGLNGILALQTNLALTGHRTLVLYDRKLQKKMAATAGPDTLCVFIIPLLRRASYLVGLFREAKKSGAKTVLLLNSRTESVKDADYALSIDGFHTMIDNYAMNMLLDMIAIKYRERYVDKVP